MELAYRLAVEDTPLIRTIREQRHRRHRARRSEPDGRDRYVDWYDQHLVGITNERDRVSGPPYWGKYIFHDNNRDINYSQVTTRAVLDWYLQWHPPIVHDLHESVPFLYTFSGQAPQNPSLDPDALRRDAVVRQLRDGAVDEVRHARRVDARLRGHVVAGVPRVHVVEPQRARPHVRDVRQRRRDDDEAPGDAAAKAVAAGQTSREWYRPSPPYKEVVWSMRNNTNYMQTAVLSALQLDVASSRRWSSRTSTRRAATRSSRAARKAPHGFVIPAGQKDRTRVARAS